MPAQSKPSRLERIFRGALFVIAAVNIALLVLSGNYASQSWFSGFLHYWRWLAAGTLASGVLWQLFTTPHPWTRFRLFIPDFFVLFIAFGFSSYVNVLLLYIIARQTFNLLWRFTSLGGGRYLYQRLTKNPASFVMVSFALAILGGTMLLMLPLATVPGQSTSLLGALFTSTSATCVTGLIVYDTGTHFSLFGQLVILGLIQVGGLGIMTISTALAILMGQRLTMASESMLQNVMDSQNRLDMLFVVRSIVAVTFIFEALGAIGLYLKFSHVLPGRLIAVYYSVFHSISAFCNAGFALYSDSLTSFMDSYIIIFTISGLIIFGGLGFSVIVDLRRNLLSRFKPQRLSLHSKIALIGTAVLLVLGFIAFFISEYCGIMRDFPMKQRLLASFFQSVTTRTAGFNSIDNGQLSAAGIFTTIVFMFVGASPGSTGGGIKTTTIALLVLSVISIARGNKDVTAFRRRIGDDTIRRVMSLLAIGVGALFLLTFMLLLFENANPKHHLSFAQLLYEAVSAFGTVGLSMGITDKLTTGGRLVIIALMYLGRIGPLTFVYAVAAQTSRASITYTEEKVAIG